MSTVACQVAEDFKLYAALYKYESDDPDDLTFEAGEILRVYDDEGDWFEGARRVCCCIRCLSFDCQARTSPAPSAAPFRVRSRGTSSPSPLSFDIHCRDVCEESGQRAGGWQDGL